MAEPSEPQSAATSPEAPFRFLDLQLELCIKILEFTDLITPLRHVQFGAGILNAKESESSPKLPWRPPTSMFLVSHTFSALAHTVFFAQNHFEMEPRWTFEEEAYFFRTDDFLLPKDVCDTADFLSACMRSRYLSNITSLEINWPNAWSWDIAESQGLRQLQETTEQFKNSFNPRRLMMHVDAQASIPIVNELYEHEEVPPVFFDHTDAIDMVRQSVGMFWPIDRLAQLDGVQMFLWHIRHPGEDASLIYYCRHETEILPAEVNNMELFEHPLDKSDGVALYMSWLENGRNEADFNHPDVELPFDYNAAEIHVKRAFKTRGIGGGRDDNQSVDGQVRPGWIEGVYFRPQSDWDELGEFYRRNM